MTSRLWDALRFLPTRRLAALAALTAPVWLLSGTATGVTIAAAVTAVVFGAALIDALLVPSTRDLGVELLLPATVGIGDEVRGEYRVSSAWRGRVRFRLFDAMPAGVSRADADAPPAAEPRGRGAALVVPPQGEVTVPVAVTGRVRGSWPFAPVVLRVVGPLGLMQRSLRFPPQAPDPAHPEMLGVAPAFGAERRDRITVTPSLSGIRRLRLLAVQHRLRDAGIRAIRRRGEGMTFANLREYALGDDPRRVDWKASARRQKLISREYTVEQGQTVVIAVDAGRLMTQLAGATPRFEFALSSALALADVATGSGDYVGLLVFDDAVRALVPPARGRLTLQRIREALIPVQAAMVEPDYGLAFRTLAARHRKRSLIVLFTDAIDPRASQALIAYTARSAARHLPIVVALRNDHLAAAAVPTGREGTADLFASAAAEELLSAREDALQRMRRSGVSVLDVSPQRMTAAVINRYLEVKARAAL